MKYFFGGVNGSGKSTLIAKIIKQNPSFERIHGTGLLMDYMGIAHNEYDRLRHVSYDITLQLMDEALGAYLSSVENKDIIVDGHYSNLTFGEYHLMLVPSFSLFDCFVLVEADASVVFSRISSDGFDRGLFADTETDFEAKISEFLEYESAAFNSAKQSFQKPGYVIDTTPGIPENAAKLFLDYHQSFDANR